MISFLRKIKQKLTSQLRRRWRRIKEIPPGRRFQERYYRLQNERQHQSQVKKLILILLGVVIILVGIFLWFVPGPGWLTIFVGAAVIAEESLTIARFLDWVEINFRKVFKRNLDSEKFKMD